MLQTRVPRLTFLGRCRGPRPAVWLLLLGALVARPVRADSLPPNPVDALRQTLRDTESLQEDAAARTYLEEKLTKEARALTTLGEMARALLLREWRAEEPPESAPIPAIHHRIRDRIMEAFTKGVKAIVKNGSPAEQAAVAQLLNETASSARSQGGESPFLLRELSGFVKPMQLLTESDSAGVRAAAARALGNIGGDAKEVVPILRQLINRDSSATVRRDSAAALGNMVDLLASSNRNLGFAINLLPGQRRGPLPAGQGDEKTLADAALLALPALAEGIASDQPSAVRRRSAEAYRSVTLNLGKLIPAIKSLDGYPYPSIANKALWSDDQRDHARHDRDKLDSVIRILNPVRREIAREAPLLSQASLDRDQAVRVAVLRILEDVSLLRSEMRYLDNLIPKDVPPPKGTGAEEKEGGQARQAPEPPNATAVVPPASVDVAAPPAVPVAAPRPVPARTVSHEAPGGGSDTNAKIVLPPSLGAPEPVDPEPAVPAPSEARPAEPAKEPEPSLPVVPAPSGTDGKSAAAAESTAAPLGKPPVATLPDLEEPGTKAPAAAPPIPRHRALYQPAADNDEAVNAEAIRVIRRTLRKALRTESDAQARLSAVEALEGMGREALEATPELVQALTDSNKYVRWAASRTLSKLQALSQADRKEANQPDMVVPGLLTLMCDQDLDVRLAATAAMRSYGPAAAGAVRALAFLVNKGDAEFRMAVMTVLESIGSAAAPALPTLAWAVLRDPDPRARRTAAEILGRFGPLAEGSEAALRRALTDPDAEVRRAASAALLSVAPKK